MVKIPSPQTSGKLHSNVYYLAITSFLTDVSSEMLQNVLPLFLVNVLGTHRGLVGLIDGVAETTASLVKIYSGALSDRLSKRKWLTVLGYSISTLAKPFLFFATTWSWVLGVRFSDRVGKGIRTAPRDALISGSVGAENRGQAFGLHRAGDTAGAFTGLGIAALVIWLMQSGASELTKNTFQLLVLISILPAVLAVFILAWKVRDVEEVPSGAKTEVVWNWKKLDKRFLRFLLVMVLFTLGNSSDSFILLRGQERGLSVLQIMGMLLLFNFIYSALSTPAGILSDRIGRRRLILVGWMIYGMCYLGFALAQSGWQVGLFFSLYGVFYALTEGNAKALVADYVPQSQRGTAYGLYNAAIGITALPASVMAGILWQGVGTWDGFGPRAPFFFGAGLAISAGILFFGWVNRD